VELTPERIVERERRWAMPAAIAAIAVAPIYLGTTIATAQFASGDTFVEQLSSAHDHPAAILAVGILRGLGFLGLILPFLFLFRAAQARSTRVQRAMVGFCFIAPVLFGAWSVAGSIGLNQASSDFVARSGELGSRDYSQFSQQLQKQPDSIDQVTLYTDSNALEVEETNGDFYAVDYPVSAEAGLTGKLDDQNVDHDEDAGGEPGDAMARHIFNDDSAVRLSNGLLEAGLLTMIVGMVYISLQALRVGLLTRFFGTLGMALGAALILPPLAGLLLLAIMIWFAYLGMLILGRARGGVPPAWATGESIPWPKPGEEEPPAGPKAPVEGTASEVSDPQEKRKRKRRR
jgi:hypothetical protein